MKIRTGFVSNSSSSSFCVAKCYIKGQDLPEFKRLVDEYNNQEGGFGEGGNLDENEYYFCGDLCYGTEASELLEFCRKKKIPHYEDN